MEGKIFYDCQDKMTLDLFLQIIHDKKRRKVMAGYNFVVVVHLITVFSLKNAAAIRGGRTSRALRRS